MRYEIKPLQVERSMGIQVGEPLQQLPRIYSGQFINIKVYMGTLNRFYIRRIAYCFLYCLVFFATGLPAQTEQVPQYKVRVEIVSIDVEVLDENGNLVRELTKDDFIVKEDGNEVKIVNFALFFDRPVSLALLLDTSTIEVKKLNIAKQFILNIIHLLDHNDDICLYTYNHWDAIRETGYTVDRPKLTAALENIAVSSKRRWGFLAEFFGPDPLTGLGIDRAIRSHRKSAHPKKALLVISNRFRGLGPATVDHIQASRCTLYTLGFDNKSAAIASLGGDFINKKQLMQESGGRKFSAETEDVMGISKKIASSMKNYYSIGYQTELGQEHTEERRIEVRIPKGKYIINARRTYSKE